MLFDPPNLRPSTAVAGTAPAQITAPQVSTATPSAPGSAGGKSVPARPPVAVAAKPAARHPWLRRPSSPPMATSNRSP